MKGFSIFSGCKKNSGERTERQALALPGDRHLVARIGQSEKVVIGAIGGAARIVLAFVMAVPLFEIG